MSRTARIVIAVLVAQVALVGVYWVVEQRRSRDHREDLSTAPPERMSGRMPALSLTARDGTSAGLPTTQRRTLVHFWATWCPPCRFELPGLLALSDDGRVDVVAIALDDDWADVDRFLDRRAGANVFLGNASEARSALGVHTLPVTFVVESGQIRLRFDGARDWSDSTFSNTWVRTDDLGSPARSKLRRSDGEMRGVALGRSNEPEQ